MPGLLGESLPPAPAGGGLTVWATPQFVFLEPAPPGLRFPGGVVRGGRLRLPRTPFVLRWLSDHGVALPPPLDRLAAEVGRLPVRAAPFEPPSPTPWWRHQAQAAGFIRALWASGFPGAGLFSTMGTGKTKVAVGLMDALGAEQVLVVGPASAARVWHAEIRKHSNRPYQIVLPDLSAKVEERLRRILVRMNQTTPPFVLIINYEGLIREPFASWALDQYWDLVVLDEIHHIKDPRGRTSLYCARLRDRARRRLGMTGTPLAHSPHDVWAQYRFLDPGVFPWSFPEFVSRYPLTPSGIRRREDFERRMGLLAFRADERVLQLPPVLFERRSLPLPAEAQALYRRLEREVAVEYATGRLTVNNALTRLLRLQQVACGHIRDDRGRLHVLNHVKEQLLDELLADVREPVVVFAEFHYDLDRIAEAAARRNWKAGELSGRRNDLDAWRSGQLDLLAVQNEAGTEAIDLTRARLGVFYSLPWSLRTWEQAVGRLHRSGQTRPVLFVYLLVEGTVDAMKPAYLERRADVVEGVLAELAERYSSPEAGRDAADLVAPT